MPCTCNGPLPQVASDDEALMMMDMYPSLWCIYLCYRNVCQPNCPWCAELVWARSFQTALGVTEPTSPLKAPSGVSIWQTWLFCWGHFFKCAECWVFAVVNCRVASEECCWPESTFHGRTDKPLRYRKSSSRFERILMQSSRHHPPNDHNHILNSFKVASYRTRWCLQPQYLKVWIH